MNNYFFLFLYCLSSLWMSLTYANNLKNSFQSPNYLLEQKVDNAINSHTTLNPYFFTNEHFNSSIKKRFQEVSNYYFLKIKQQFPKAKLIDILFIGSLAGYGYTDDSDVDLHLLINFNVSCDKGLLNEYVTLLRYVWHVDKISIGNYPVQITPVSAMIKQGGIYSLLNNQWIQKPRREKITYSKAELINTIKTHQNELINLEKIYDSNPNPLYCQKLIDYANELKAWRSKGLTQKGITSMENIAFRVMRSLGNLDTLTKAIRKCEAHTIDSLLNPKLIKI